MDGGDVSVTWDCDFALNDGEVTILGGAKQPADSPAGMDGKVDGSDSGVELNGAEPAERSASPALGTALGALQDYDGTSEGGSESSSVLSLAGHAGHDGHAGHAGHAPARRKASSSSCPQHAHPRSRSVATASPASSPTAPIPAPRPRERSSARGSSCSRGRQGAPDATLSRVLSRSQSQRVAPAAPAALMTSSLTGSLTASSGHAGHARGRGATRTNAPPRPAPRGSATTTSTDDGRWPSTVQRERPTTLVRTRASSVATDRADRGRHGAPGLAGLAGLTSSSSKTSVNSTNSASTPSPTVENKSEKFSTLPRRRRRRSVESVDRAAVAGASQAAQAAQASRKARVTLYHETAAQTALTLQDLDDALGGRGCQLRPVDAKELAESGVQAERDREDFATQSLDRRLKAILDMLGFEHSGTPRTPRTPRSPGGPISSTVSTPPKEIDHTAWMKSLELLEQRAATIKRRDALQRGEIGRLRHEVEHVERLRRRLQSEQEETEAETVEMQEFLQVEKSMLAESLKEAEREVQAQKKIAEGLNEELERQREECQHLVRMSEQRRQEVLTLQARVAALEQRSKESLLQQGAAVSGASVALSALSSRLDDLAMQLEENSVEKALSALSVEAEAVTTRTKEACRPLSVHLENGFQTLDNVTEPELEDEGGGQRDSTISENGDCARLANSESIQNLSAAILYRRMQEEAIRTESNASEDVHGHLVDQILDVDSLISRVLRAICDAVHSKRQSFHSEEGEIQTCTGAASPKVETKVFQKIADNIDSSKTNHVSLLNGSSEGSCSDSKNMAVNGRVEIGLKSEPVTGAA